ncbi:OpgC family protein [Hymenobacter crusticola]|uniref:Acyltransferase 3 domain-containing protein n=1 Tax=Hymenobacter crusticola TaxID=1770526 RepID=A0A243WFA3_9BACT|nr:OpgC domain-containing protein [Hymenobacter crusticola]OUJ73807.1 hypothetical protein BXP70_12585 [Hymenobacter crusticola]
MKTTSKLERSHQLDFFRGILLILITIDHALAYNNIIKRFTYEFFGWVSGAEGFVFLSGLTAGLIYTYKFLEKGNAFVLDTSFRRVQKIYTNHILLLLFAFAMVLAFTFFVSSDWMTRYWMSTYPFFFAEPAKAIVLGLLLLYQPTYLDILPMYAVFILFVPFLVKSLQKKAMWLVLLVSFLLYVVGSASSFYPFLDNIIQSPLLKMRYFNLLCWQFLFVIGLVSGFLFYHGKTKEWQRNKYLFGLAICVSVLFFGLKNAHVEIAGINLEYLTDKANLGPLRLLNFLALCYTLTFIASKKGNWFASRPICYLGRNSLEVFTLHIALIIVFMPILYYLNKESSIDVYNEFKFYPLETALVFFVIIPALFLAPFLLNEKYRVALINRSLRAIEPEKIREVA